MAYVAYSALRETGRTSHGAHAITWKLPMAGLYGRLWPEAKIVIVGFSCKQRSSTSTQYIPHCVAISGADMG